SDGKIPKHTGHEVVKPVPDGSEIQAILLQEKTAELEKGKFLTNDIVVLHGKIGGDNHELQINGRPPLILEPREHTLFLILAYYARYYSQSNPVAFKKLPVFLPVRSIVAILNKLTAED